MKTIIVMLAIVILAVSTVGCGGSQTSQNQTSQTVLGDWTGNITGAPAPFPTSFVLNFGAAQGAYGLTVGGWFDSGMYVSSDCSNPSAQTIPVIINGASFTMTNLNTDDTLITITGTVTGTSTGNTATGTVTFPNLCGYPSWTGNFIATRTSQPQ